MIRPVDAEISQRFGDNPTRNLPASSWLIQTFGNYQPDGHTGEDYACPIGSPVRAVADGTVLHIGWMGGTYDQNPWWIQPSFAGYHAVIDHGSFIGIYGHCSDGSAKVAKGARVSEGQVFILSGNTGGSTGPHLHFEVLPDQYVLNSTFYGRIDPEPLFSSSLSYASESITPVQEDDMATVPQDEWEWAKQVLTALSDNAATKKDLAGVPQAVVTAQVPYKDPVTGQDTGQTTSLATMAGYADFQASATRALVLQGPAGLAQQINAAGLAAQVRDELVKLIGGAK